MVTSSMSFVIGYVSSKYCPCSWCNEQQNVATDEDEMSDCGEAKGMLSHSEEQQNEDETEQNQWIRPDGKIKISADHEEEEDDENQTVLTGDSLQS